MTDKIKLERTELADSITVLGDDAIKTITWTVEQYKKLEASRNRWRDIARMFYEANYEQDGRLVRTALDAYDVRLELDDNA